MVNCSPPKNETQCVLKISVQQKTSKNIHPHKKKKRKFEKNILII